MRQFLVILAVGLLAACMVQTNLPRRVTTENVRRVQLGMSREDVERIERRAWWIMVNQSG